MRMAMVRLKFKWWSLQNFVRGYRFSAVRRCRFCDHTTPYHYATCRRAVLGVSQPEDTP